MYQAILTGSLFLLLAFAIDRYASKAGLPSVVALIATGMIAKPVLAMLGIVPYGLEQIVPVIGAVGLVLIVLEGAFDIELKRDRLRSAGWAILISLLGLLLCALVLAFAAKFFLDIAWHQAVVLALPVSVISSAVAISSSSFLPEKVRNFVVYESSISDVLGILFFFSLIHSDGSVAGVVREIVVGGLSSVVLAFVCALGLMYVLTRSGGHIRFIPLLAGLFAIYSAAELMHLSPLIMVLLFGLIINNPSVLSKVPFFHVDIEDRDETIAEFKTLTMELTFAVRGFFFVLLGMWTQPSVFLSVESWGVALVVLSVIFSTRYVLLHTAKVEWADTMTWIAPRGLITVLLFMVAKGIVNVPSYIDGAMTIIVLISSLMVAAARFTAPRLPSP